MGAIGFGAGARPPGAGRAASRRIRGIGAGEFVPPGGGGDVRRMRNVGGYSTVGFRAIPPIGRKPAPGDHDADTLTDALLARADEVLARADAVLAGAESGGDTTAAAEAAPPEHSGDELAGAGASR